MPANLGAEYANAEEKYLSADSRVEKIEALEEMIAACPKHKGTENLRAELKSKLSKLRDQSDAEVHQKTVDVPRHGEAQITVIGLPNSGKSTLLEKLTGAEPEIEDYEYTTTEPEVGMVEWKDVQLQLVEIPSTWTGEMISIAHGSDLVLFLIDSREDYEEQKKELQELLPRLGTTDHIWVLNSQDEESIMEKIWDALGRIRIYTKTPGKEKDLPAITFPHESTVRDVAENVHKDFVEKFKFARIYGPSADFDGQQVGLDHTLLDGDVVELHTK